ncbi:2-oxoglutarate dehydrogenase E1 component [Paenibacillus sp. yr247]|uniref:2-oxoglutarate dehydrogenase E1 component n=1 Tax=Paenibacillus sp. yr247 TaxID=1761880 RepID=UPI0008803342|nr:2-oxoglutarate dehydrogenase E1 component [Paenibacillus sp. yr247]SDO12486.1 2-oxoglutarate dehydrogenase E1 component [Paenibacillus sp. yr247]
MNREERNWQAYTGPNLGYVMEQYERYTANSESVDPGFRELFRNWGGPGSVSGGILEKTQNSVSESGFDWNMLQKVATAGKLVWNIRTYGHLAADIDPQGLSPKAQTRLIEPAAYHLSQADLEAIPASLIWENAPADVRNSLEAIERLYQAYTGTMAYEFTHVHEESERDWLNKRVENGALTNESLTVEERTMLLERLIETEQFERFLHLTFVGQKRFSIEGNDALVPVLDETIRSFVRHGSRQIMFGMAHRGRLNTLAHVLGKPYSKIFAEFQHSPNKDIVPSEGSTGINYGWSGDVKYHLGADHDMEEGGQTVRLVLANNPSHLEFVNPVVEGFTRAAQEDREHPGFPKQDTSKAVAVLLHGDAAFAGEGIVAETLNFTRLAGYCNGGTIHIIVNNRLGFTTDSQDSRSTHYASDLAKGFEIPIIHVNADDPEACITAVRIACEFRIRFGKDFLIDLVGYRRYGHNESDDPETTQPVMYGKLRNHPTVSELYAKKLAQEGIVDEATMERMKQEAISRLQKAYEEMKQGDKSEAQSSRSENLLTQEAQSKEPETAVQLDRLKELNDALLKRPDGFKAYPKLQRILERRANAFDEGGKVDWALAETLAFATLLSEGKPIRLSGQDSQRGTFAHRHLVLHDAMTGDAFCPLHAIPQARASFAIYNSPLSEASVLGFEYGYNVLAPETFVIWEAQYGDFANAAQVIIDQFLAAGRSKWRQKSSLTLLLPHGYEGQGPEHSSARLERYLQLSGEENWTVVNLTRASQYFHLLRKQAMLTESEQARPLIVMAPKSLIRHPRVASAGSDFAEGKFQPVLEQSGSGNETSLVKRLIFCCGKVAIDLEEAIESEGKNNNWLHVVRIEQLYPFPANEINSVVRRFSNVVELVWLQEEPQNMGAWWFMEQQLRQIVPESAAVRYIGRSEHASTASGFHHVHESEQQRIISNALDQSLFDNDH